MVAIFSKRTFMLNCVNHQIDSIDELTIDDKILIVDEEHINNNNLKSYCKKNDLIVVFITESYLHNNAKLVYQNRFNYYIQINNNSELDEFLKMLAISKFGNVNISINQIANEIIIEEEVVKLTTNELLIFTYLFERRGKLCLRGDMLSEILNYPPNAETRIIDVYIKYLRTKLKKEGKKIETIRGQGYIYHE